MNKIMFGNGSIIEPLESSQCIRSNSSKSMLVVPDDEDDLIGFFINEKCPKCGATLLGNKAGDKWCSFVGGMGSTACDYGCE